MKHIKLCGIVLSAVFSFCLLAAPHHVFAGSCSSVAGTSWNTGANWSAGCTGVGGIPGTGDDVTIASGHPITLDIDTPALSSLTINDTLDTGTNRAINVTGGVSSSGTLTINSGGILTAHASTITLGTWFYNAVGTFNPGTSTVVIANLGSTTVINGTNNFYNLTFSPNEVLSNQFRIVSPTTVSNNFTIAPSGASATLTVSLESSLNVGGTLSIGGSGSAVSVFDTHGNAIVTGFVTIGSAGTLTANNSGITITGTSGTLFSDAGTFTAGTSSVNFTGNGTATLNSGSPTFFTVVSIGNGTKSVGGGGISFASGGLLSVQGGTFNSNSLINSSPSASLSVTNGTILVPTSMGVEYPFGTITLGTGSTADYNEAGAQTIESSITYYNLTISGSFTKKPNGTLNVTSTLTVNSGTFDTNFNIDQTVNVGYVVENGGTVQLNTSIINFSGTSGTLYTWNGGGIGATSFTFNLTGNGSAVINSTTIAICHLNSTGTGTKSAGGTLSFRNNCTLNITNGTFNPNGNMVVALGTNNISVTNATLNVDASTFAGSYVSFSTVTLGSGSTVNYMAGGAQTIDSTKTYVDLTTGGSGTKSLNGTTTVSGTLTIGGTSAVNTSGSNYTLNVGHIALAGGNFNPNGSLINLTGTSGSLITVATGGQTLGTAVFNMTGNGDATLLGTGASGWGFASLVSSGTGTKTAGGSFTINSPGPLTISNGTFDPGTNTISSVGGTSSLSVTDATLKIKAATFAGNFSAFTPTFGTGSTVDYAGSVTQTVDNSASFYNLTLSGPAREIDFPVSGNITVSNAFLATGSVGNNLSLYSVTPGTGWTLAPSGSASGSYVTVRDGYCGGSVLFFTTDNFTDEGHNGTCWTALAATTRSTVRNGGRSSVLVVPVTTGNTPNVSGNNGARNVKKVTPNTFSRSLRYGSSGADVTLLQKILIENGFLVMPKGAAFGYFGISTKNALQAFQTKNGIAVKGDAGYGLFGPKTMAALSATIN